MTVSLRSAAPLLVVAVVVALIGAGMLAARRWWSAGSEPGTSSVAGRTDDATGVRAAPPTDEFLVFARTPRGTSGQAGPEYIATGLQRLAGALDSLDIGSDELALDLRVATAHVRLQPTSVEIATLVRDLAIRTAQALPATPAGAAVVSRAQAINGDRSLVQQQQVMQDFFAAAADALAALQPHRTSATGRSIQRNAPLDGSSTMGPTANRSSL